MSVHTRSQRLAKAAYARIARHGEPNKEYVSFAKKFPALIHTCGLAQAVAFALAKNETDYVEDLAEVLKASGHPAITSRDVLAGQSRESSLSAYLRLSRDAINAAGWLKRYVEAAGEEG
jgi:CRISPR-associated protein Cmr5